MLPLVVGNKWEILKKWTTNNYFILSGQPIESADISTVTLKTFSFLAMMQQFAFDLILSRVSD